MLTKRKCDCVIWASDLSFMVTYALVLHNIWIHLTIEAQSLHLHTYIRFMHYTHTTSPSMKYRTLYHTLHFCNSPLCWHPNDWEMLVREQCPQWTSGRLGMLRMFRQGGDIYNLFGSREVAWQKHTTGEVMFVLVGNFVSTESKNMISTAWIAKINHFTTDEWAINSSWKNKKQFINTSKTRNTHYIPQTLEPFLQP